jgi:hypothetical protein
VLSGSHVHTGFVVAVTVTVYAIIGLNVWRLAAAHAANSSNPTIAGIGQSAGALVHFGG